MLRLVVLPLLLCAGPAIAQQPDEVGLWATYVLYLQASECRQLGKLDGSQLEYFHDQAIDVGRPFSADERKEIWNLVTEQYADEMKQRPPIDDEACYLVALAAAG